MSENREKIVFHCNINLFGADIEKGTFVRKREWVGLTDSEKAFIKSKHTRLYVKNTVADTTNLNSCVDEDGIISDVESLLRKKNYE